ncbi:MAG: putative Ig domain-containing protein [Acidimicrobiales bacterium]
MKKALVLALAVLGSLPGLLATSASASSSHPPLALSVSAVPRQLPASGGTVAVLGRVSHASSCQLQLLSRQGFPVVYSHNPTTACRSGAYSAHVVIGANPSPLARTVAFELVARNGAFSSGRRFYVTLAAAAKPQVLSARALPSYIWGRGGQVTVLGRVSHASSCELRLISRQGFPVVYSHNPTTACRSGAYSAHVVIGANPSPLARTVAFALVARSGAFSSSRRFYVTLAAHVAPPATTTTTSALRVVTAFLPGGSVGTPYYFPLRASGGEAPYLWYAESGTLPAGMGLTTGGVLTGAPTQAGDYKVWVTVIDSLGNEVTASFSIEITGGAVVTTTTVPPTTTTTVPPTTTTTVPPTTTTTTTTANASVVQEATTNWSGYAVTGGPYTEVQGTFTVPVVTPSGCDSEVSVWAGIDGFGSTDSDLIQAGVGEGSLVAQPGSSACTGDQTWAWWEILPALPVVITNWGDGAPATVTPGDQVTVTIWEVSNQTWAIRVTDDSTGGSFETEQSYNGPGASAEWVVEDPGNVGQGCDVIVNGASGQCPMPPYSPGVTFTDMGISPNVVSTWYEVTLVQNGVAISTPSFYSDGTFSVSYTASSEAAQRSAQLAKASVKTLATP